MDLQTIQRLALAAREFSPEPLPGQGARVSVTLRVPTRHEVQLALRRCQAGADTAGMLLLERALLEQAVVAWAGVQVRDVLPDHPNDDAMPLEPGAVPLLLDAQPDWAQAWATALLERMRQARQVEEAAEKN